MKAQPPFADSKPIRGGDVAGKGFSLPRMPEPSTDWEANPGADRAPDPAPFLFFLFIGGQKKADPIV